MKNLTYTQHSALSTQHSYRSALKKLCVSVSLCVIFLVPSFAQKADTIVLSVYNNNQRFMLYPMPFGKDRPDKDFTAEMVVVLDTVNVSETSTKKDTSGKYPKQWLVQRKCGKLSTSVRDKVALIYMSKDCDVSTQVLMAQDSGAVVAIVIHTTDNRDSVAMPKKSGKIKYDNDNKVKIPCFTVRKGIGEILTQMLPSLVGIQRPKTDVGNVQPLQTPPTNTNAAAPNTAPKKVINSDSTNTPSVQPTLFNPQSQKGWFISPNPAAQTVVLDYNFEEKHPLSIEVYNELGQLVTNYQLPDTQTGQLNVDVSAWQNGSYNVTLSNGLVKETKRLIVVH